MIQHSEYFDGAVQSLGDEDRKGNRFTVGIVKPGVYAFDTAESQETIKVIFGFLVINGKPCMPDTPPCVIPTGEEIKIEAPNGIAAYLCTYG